MRTEKVMRVFSTRTLVRIVCSGLVCCTAMACGLFKPAYDIGNPKLEAGLEGVCSPGGKSAYLREFTDWAWDEVYVFQEYTRAEEIKRAVGSSAIGDFDYRGNLLVFKNKGKVAKAIALGLIHVYAERNGKIFGAAWPANVMVERNGEPRAVCFVRFTLPAAPAATN